MKTLKQERCYLNSFRFCLNSKCQRSSVHMSSLYRPVLITPPNKQSNEKDGNVKEKGGGEPLSRSQRLLLENGLIKQSSCSGAFHLLPIAQKAMEKLVRLVDNHMQSLQNCQKIQMPTLTSASLWKSTGRLEMCKPELMQVEDRHSKIFLLSPTHEEAICDLVKNPPLSQRQLPLRLYQITEKFRDEKRPRFGLLRGRQFLMKDLYTFDVDPESAEKTYSEVNSLYGKLLDSLNMKWTEAIGSTGSIGGSMSHEFHLVSDVGEDSIIHCGSCNHTFNAELLDQEELKHAVASGAGAVATSDSPKCVNCGSTSSLSNSTSIEIAHSFLLGTKYTKPLQALYINSNNAKIPLEMGCYGLGVSRLLAAALEVKSTSKEIRWPDPIAPYLCSIIPPKEGSKEESRGSKLALKLYESLKKIIPGDVIYDDRTSLTIGKRLLDTKKLGIPFVVVCGKAVNDEQGPLLEFHDVNASSMRLDDSDKIVKTIYNIKSKIADCVSTVQT